MSEKNAAIKNSFNATKERRKNQLCRSFELKVDRSHLSTSKLRILNRLFLEAKWFHNHILSKDDIFNQDYKLNHVKITVKDHFEDREITILSSQMRQEMIDRMKDNIRSLSSSKKNGRKIGKLHFKTRIDSIPLKQYGNTYKIEGNYVRIQNLGKLKVSGLKQIPEHAEIANAVLLRENGDYFIHVTTYSERKEKTFPLPALGTDFGIKHALTLSNGIAIDERVTITDKIVKLHRELSRREYHGRNWFKTLLKLNKAYDLISRQRRDIRNKIVSLLTENFESIAVQDDSIRGWMIMWGKRVQASAIGGIMSDLKRKTHTPVIVPRFTPTSQTCTRCGHRQEMDLDERTFNCESCGISIDRDYNASLNSLYHNVPAERREVTPIDIKTSTRILEYLNSIPGVHASLVDEIGSLVASA